MTRRRPPRLRGRRHPAHGRGRQHLPGDVPAAPAARRVGRRRRRAHLLRRSGRRLPARRRAATRRGGAAARRPVAVAAPGRARGAPAADAARAPAAARALHRRRPAEDGGGRGARHTPSPSMRASSLHWRAFGTNRIRPCSDSRCCSSTWRSERSRRTPTGSSRAAPRPRARTSIWCSRPSSRSPATRPRTCCSAPRSSPPAGARWSRSAGRIDVPLLVGSPWLGRDRVHNSAFLLAGGEIRARYDKQHLPNYGVFDEERTFAPGRHGLAFEAGGALCAVTVCEDLWLSNGPAGRAARGGATVILNISSSPYHVGKALVREEMLRTRARDELSIIAYCNLVGGQDELVFDGRSGGRRRRRRHRGAGSRLRGGGAGLRGRPGRCGLRASARHAAAARQGAPGARAARDVRSAPAAAAASSRASRRHPASPEADLWARARASVCATTRPRTASAACCSACPAASTRRWSPRWRPTRSARIRSTRISMPTRFNVVGDAVRRPARGREPRRRLPRAADRGPARRVRRGRARRDRHRGRERAGPHPRRDPDDRVEPARPPGADDVEQVGDGRRLHDAVRRLGGRLRADQGRAEDAGVRARPVAQRAGRPRADPGVDHRPAAQRRAARGPARRPEPAALRACSTRSSRPTWSATWRRTRSSRSASAMPSWCGASRGSSTSPSTSAGRRRPV